MTVETRGRPRIHADEEILTVALRAFAAQGYEVVFAGQGSWGCFAYIWMRDDLGTIVELLDHGNLACRAPS